MKYWEIQEEQGNEIIMFFSYLYALKGTNKNLVNTFCDFKLKRKKNI